MQLSYKFNLILQKSEKKNTTKERHKQSVSLIFIFSVVYSCQKLKHFNHTQTHTPPTSFALLLNNFVNLNAYANSISF